MTTPNLITTDGSSPTARRSTIHLNPATLAILGEPPVPSMSGRIAQVVEAYAHACDVARLSTDMRDAPALSTMLVRYREIARHSMPKLSQAEWSLICDALNGCWLAAESARMDPARFLDHEIADCQPDGMGEKWGVDVPALATKLHALPYAARCAVTEVVARFWRSPRLNELTTRALLIECGARMAD